MIISISGQSGSGKSTAAKLLAKKLNFTHYSIGDLRRRMAKERGLTIEEFNKIGEKQDFTDKEADEYQINLGKTEDNFVIDARLAFHFIPHAVKIFLTASLDERARRVFSDKRETEKYRTVEQAKKSLQEMEKGDLRRYKQYYNINHLDHKQYDLVIDSTALSPEEVVSAIVQFLEKKSYLKQKGQ